MQKQTHQILSQRNRDKLQAKKKTKSKSDEQSVFICVSLLDFNKED